MKITFYLILAAYFFSPGARADTTYPLTGTVTIPSPATGATGPAGPQGIQLRPQKHAIAPGPAQDTTSIQPVK